MRPLNLEQLASLVAVADLGGFTAAARARNLSQPAVSQQIRDLEERHGVTLVERLGRRVQPTQAGRALVEHARRLLTESEAALATLKRHRDGGLGRVRIGTGTAALTYLLPPILARLRAQQPGIELAVSTGPTEQMLERLRANELDLGLIPLPAETEGFLLRRIRSDPLVAILPAGDAALAAAVGAAPTAPALARQTLILEGNRGSHARLIRDWFAAAGLEMRAAMWLSSIEAVRNTVVAGLGCAILPSEVVAGGNPAGLRVLLLEPPVNRPLALVHRREKLEDPAFRQVRRALLALSRKSGPTPGVAPGPGLC